MKMTLNTTHCPPDKVRASCPPEKGGGGVGYQYRTGGVYCPPGEARASSPHDNGGMGGYRYNQRGAGMMNVMFTLFMVIVVAILVVRIIPPYLENLTISSILTGLEEDRKTYMSVIELQDALWKRISINDIKTITQEDIGIVEEDNWFIVTIVYEVRKPLFGNMDIILNFSEKAELPIR